MIITKKKYNLKIKRLAFLLEQLTQKGKLSQKMLKELDIISDEIAGYEENQFPFKPSNLNEMIELRMYQRKLKQKDLATILGTSPSRISEILNGKRGLTLELAKGLYKKLNIDADIILNSPT